MMPPIDIAPARVLGKKAGDRSVLTSVSRGETVVIMPKATYNKQGYTFEDVCALGSRIMRMELKMYTIQKYPEDFSVPYSTMAGWIKKDIHGVPKWQLERDVLHKTKLPKSGGVKGGGTVFGEAAEREVCKSMGRAALGNMPYGYAEIECTVRNTAIELGRVVTNTNKLYDSLTDVSTLVRSFIVRMAKEKIYFVEKHGRKLGLQRHINQNYESLRQFAIKINSAFLAFQILHNIILWPRVLATVLVALVINNLKGS